MLSTHTTSAETCTADLNCDGEVNKLDKQYFNDAYRTERNITTCDPCPEPPVVLAFSDDFDDGEAEGWWLGYSQEDPQDGNWRIEHVEAPHYGVLVQDEGGDHYIALVENIQCSNQIIETQLKLKQGSGVGGVTVWFQNDDNWVEIYMYPAANHIRIYENINGSKTADPYGVYPHTAYNNTWYNLKVIANSTTGGLDIYVDDVYLFTHTVITTNRSGQSGVMTSNSGAYFDDFKLTVNCP